MLTSRRWYLVTWSFFAYYSTEDYVKINCEMPTGTKTGFSLYGYEQ